MIASMLVKRNAYAWREIVWIDCGGGISEMQEMKISLKKLVFKGSELCITHLICVNSLDLAVYSED